LGLPVPIHPAVSAWERLKKTVKKKFRPFEKADRFDTGPGYVLERTVILHF
jgi:hypothetical protein